MPGRKRRSSPINCGGGRRLQPAGSPLCRWPGAEFWQGKKPASPGCSPPRAEPPVRLEGDARKLPSERYGAGGGYSPFLWSPLPPLFCTGVFVSTGLRPGSLELGRKQGTFLPPVDFQRAFCDDPHPCCVRESLPASATMYPHQEKERIWPGWRRGTRCIRDRLRSLSLRGLEPRWSA